MSTQRVWIICHRRERMSKCSLRTLAHPYQQMAPSKKLELTLDLCRIRYPFKIDLASTLIELPLMLDFEGEMLTSLDLSKPLLLLDATWRLAEKMSRIPQVAACPKRKLDSEWKTAYPRRQGDCSEPARGLASVEALYAACIQMGIDRRSLLDNYYWKEAFLSLNASVIERWMP